MSFPFTAQHGPIILEASVSGPLGQADLRVILDTGATMSLIRSTLSVVPAEGRENGGIERTKPFWHCMAYERKALSLF